MNLKDFSHSPILHQIVLSNWFMALLQLYSLLEALIKLHFCEMSTYP